MSLISKPLFRTNNTENLEAADAYDITNNRPINKIYESAKSGVRDLIERAGGARNIGNSISALVQMKQAGYGGKELLQASLGMFGTSVAGLLKTTGGAVFDKAAAFIDLDPSIVEKVKIGGNYVADALEYGDPSRLGDLQGLVGIMGDMGLDPNTLEMINIGVESAVWGAALAGASSLNLFDYFDAVRDNTDPDVYYQAVVFALPTVAGMGSLQGLDAMLSAVGAENILVNQPDFIQIFISNFTIPTPQPADLKAYGVELANKLKLIDRNWYTYQRGEETIIDFKYMSTPSRDAIRVLELHDEIGPAIQIAQGYPEIAVSDSLREQFPMMVAQ